MKKIAILALLSVVCLTALPLRYDPIGAGLAAEPVTTPTIFVYLPFVAKNWLPAPTPTATPIPPILYEGLTDQGGPISLEVEPDFSAVRKITINFRFSCGGKTIEGTTNVGQGPIQEGSFAIETYYVFVTGSFAADFSSVEGTWQGIMYDPLGRELCRGPVGTWSASRK